jgi:hypothetical protein
MSDTVRPTKKQRELLTFIEHFISEHGYSPSYREIMTGLSYTSVATVALHVNNLIKRGHLRKREHSARSLEVTAPTLTDAEGVTVPSNAVKPGEEKWLIGKIEHFFIQAEQTAAADLTEDIINQLYVLLGALRVLGLDGGAQSFMPRLTALRERLAESSETDTTGSVSETSPANPSPEAA